VADRRGVDIISSGRDPDRRRSSRPRLLAAVIAAALAGGGIAAHIILGGSARTPHHPARRPPPSLTVAAPAMLHGTPLRAAAAPATLLFVGGNDLRLLNARSPAPTPVASAPPGDASNPLGPVAVVRQIVSVAGGIVAVLAGNGPAGLPLVGDVLFVPTSGSRAGAARLIARANYVAVAPGGRDIWVEQAGLPHGDGPAASPAWLIDEAGHRLSPVVRMHQRVVAAVTTRGLLVQDGTGHIALIDPVSGTVVHSGIPRSAIIAGTGSDLVAWQSLSCASPCPLYVTDLRGGPPVRIALPPRTSLDYADASAFDPAGRRFAIPLDISDRRGLATGTRLYVADLVTRTLIEVPGGVVPLASLPSVPGAFPAHTTDVVSVRWTADGSRLWIVVTDGLFFQAAYWPGDGPMRVLRPQPGLAYKFDLPGPGSPGR
jgi:hypothetical protein